ncbi:hypothetical protein TI39_contig313g00004 [Zymoseptoria brevis]|uniref:Uncharacterized protein n=1 Tax=Zymoseptoria brevis TaxID=1047168 RepID=A0A0F4GUM3_9PEZI|nr:hypothetical protein TI39_contig313g00004 [Zymoseptoria brevis]
MASIHDVWEDDLIRKTSHRLFPSVTDLRLCGWMHRGLVRAILDSIDTSRLHSFKLDSLDEEGALPGGGPIEQGTARKFSKNIRQGLISEYEELVIDNDLFERQEQSTAAIFPGPMWFPLRVLSSATLGSLSTMRLTVSSFDDKIDIRNSYTSFRHAANLVRNASSTLESLTIIFGESPYLYNPQGERCGTHALRNQQKFFEQYQVGSLFSESAVEDTAVSHLVQLFGSRNATVALVLWYAISRNS